MGAGTLSQKPLTLALSRWERGQSARGLKNTDNQPPSPYRRGLEARHRSKPHPFSKGMLNTSNRVYDA